MLKKINALRTALKKRNADGYIVPSTDEFQNEYTPLHLRRLEYLTGFTGSNGIAIVTLKKAAFFTDGRYLLQAKNELDKEFEIFNMAEEHSNSWLAEAFKKGDILGYDPMLHSQRNIESYEKIANKYGFKLKALNGNLVDELWQEKRLLQAAAFELPGNFTGEESKSKIAKIVNKLHTKADFLLLTNPDSISWLLNIRSNQIPYTPLVLAYLLMSKNGEILLFTDATFKQKLKVKIHPLKNMQASLKAIVKSGAKIQFDSAKTPIWFGQNIPPSQVTYQTDPCEILKACKNKVEITGFRLCHLDDGVALTKFLCWLSTNKKAKITEMVAAEKLLEFRQQNKLFQYPSFETISAYGEHGAVIHYSVNPKSNKTIGTNNLYLIDSGGQYFNGTTDVTRTIFLGKNPSAELKQKFTLVLKGHIAIAKARFPKGTTGLQLDALARYHLWQAGADYAHGTGHGVGHFLSVHEGPQRISKTIACNVPLEEGMVLSNEPGFYLEGRYGIRIENLLLVAKSTFNGFLEFETLTMAPIQGSLVDKALLSSEELAWLKDYNNDVYKKLKPHLTPKEREFLEKHIGF